MIGTAGCCYDLSFPAERTLCQNPSVEKKKKAKKPIRQARDDSTQSALRAIERVIGERLLNDEKGAGVLK